jgi:hypothetical protein
MKAKSLNQELHQLKKNRQFLTILILLFVCAIFWTGFTLITSQHKSKLSNDLIRLAEPLSPTLDAQVLASMEQKTWYDEDQLSGFLIVKLVASKDDRVERAVSIDAPDEDPSVLFARLSASPSPGTSPLPGASPSPNASPSPSPAGSDPTANQSADLQ